MGSKTWKASLTSLTICCAVFGVGRVVGAARAPKQGVCDASLEAAFEPGSMTKILNVRRYAKGEKLPSGPIIPSRATAHYDLCRVKLLVGPGNPGPAGASSTSEGIGIEVWLPSVKRWNGRLHALGGGGFGVTRDPDIRNNLIEGISSDIRSSTDIAAEEGSVVAVNDTGHRGPDTTGSFGLNPDGKRNKALIEDYSRRAVHEMAVNTKMLIARFYGTGPKFSYFDGSSLGGRQGMKEAQSYPDDFDGILSGMPAINWNKYKALSLYIQLVYERDLNGKHLSSDQLNSVSNAAIAACDVVGGQHLGYIIDQASCRYDPMRDPAVLCVSDGGRNSTPSCITRIEAFAINKFWYGMTADGSAPAPAVNDGWRVELGNRFWYGLPRGTNLTGLAGAEAYFTANGTLAWIMEDPAFGATKFVNARGKGRDAWKAMSYSQLAQAFQRGLSIQQELAELDTDNPDLSGFKRRGGKLLQFHGISDPLVPVQGTINYFERVQSAMGDADSVRPFYNLYLVPGLGHGTDNGTSNPNANPPVPGPGQLFNILVAWVEKGIAPPERIDVRSRKAVPTAKSQPICRYPKRAAYASGDVNVASSYTCS
jgi:hypothetical protein